MDLMTRAEVAELLRTPENTLRHWRQIGIGPKAGKVGRRVMYRRADVEAWIEEQFTEATA